MGLDCGRVRELLGDALAVSVQSPGHRQYRVVYEVAVREFDRETYTVTDHGTVKVLHHVDDGPCNAYVRPVRPAHMWCNRYAVCAK